MLCPAGRSVGPAVRSDTQSVDRIACRVELMRSLLGLSAVLFICLGKCDVKVICWQLQNCGRLFVKNYSRNDEKQLDSS
jgi:hypothetical protein